METYREFAFVYDIFMDNVPYDDWAVYLHGVLKEYGILEGTVVDIGCGTGEMTRRLAQLGYDMIGLDYSQEMLQAAVEKQDEEETKILYIMQDMRKLELGTEIKAAVSICDSMNYILDEAELMEVFRRVNQYLEPGGVFVFDLNTRYKYETIIGECTIAENRDDASFIWENYFDAGECINEYLLTLFIREESGLYRKYEEAHYQRAYSIIEIERLLTAAGMAFAGVYDGDTHGMPHEKSERLYIIAMKSRNGGK